MRKLLWLTVLAAAAPSLSLSQTPAAPVAPKTCADAGAPEPGPARLKLMQGFGRQHWEVKTGSKDAQSWFDYGLQLSHAFNHKEGVEAFKRAERADPTCAMCVWGEAWSAGPTINYDIEEADRAANLALVEKAAVMAEGGPEKEGLLIAALRARYTGPNDKGQADIAFAKAMDPLAEKYAADDEVQVIASDAWLKASQYGEDKTALERSVALAERVLGRNPDDAGAIHFYIHATEIAGYPARAEAAADRLARVAPNAAHLVHMPSHTYFAIGRYEDAATANYAAMQADHDLLKALGVQGDVWRMSYHQHNVRFGMAGALMANDAEIGMKLADHHLPFLDDLKPSESGMEYSAAMGFLAYGRFAEPATVLALKDPGAGKPVARRVWRYARGEALARLGDWKGVEAEARLMDKERRTLAKGNAPALGEIMRNVLLGRAAMLKGKPDKARGYYEVAAKIQEKNFSGWGDPPIWWYPVRRSVAAAYLQAGRWKEAEREAAASLKAWPHDPLALMVLAEAERKLGKAADADGRMADARTRWKGKLDGFSIGQV